MGWDVSCSTSSMLTVDGSEAPSGGTPFADCSPLGVTSGSFGGAGLSSSFYGFRKTKFTGESQSQLTRLFCYVAMSLYRS